MGAKIELLQLDRPVVAPGVWGGLSALMAQRAGFQAVFQSGNAYAASRGLPDADLHSVSDILGATRDIVAATEIPVIVDIDHGYGGPAQVAHVVRSFDAAGAAAVVIEDLVAPKRHPMPLTRPLPVVSMAEATAKVRAAVDHADQMLVVARTESAVPDETLRRAVAFAGAGADLIFVVGLQDAFDEEHLHRVHRESGLPLLVHITPGHWSADRLTEDVAKDIGVAIAIAPMQLLMAEGHALQRTLAKLRSWGSLGGEGLEFLGHDELGELVGLHKISEIESKYQSSQHEEEVR